VIFILIGTECWRAKGTVMLRWRMLAPAVLACGATFSLVLMQGSMKRYPVWTRAIKCAHRMCADDDPSIGKDATWLP
jgi:hypothetical protein